MVAAYMDSIRSIQEKIRSCISCDQNQCPLIKERLDHHVQSHHSSRRSLNSRKASSHQKCTHLIHASRSSIADAQEDAQTSTSDLTSNKESKKVSKKDYKKDLRSILLECLKNVYTSQNASDRNVEENIINEFIEDIYKLSENKDDNYEDELYAALEDLLNSLSLNIDKKNDRIMGNLQTKIATKIIDLNENTDTEKFAGNVKKRKISNIFKDKSTSSLISKKLSVENDKNNVKVQDSDVDLLLNSLTDTDNTLTPFNLENNKPTQKRTIDIQVSDFSSPTLVEDNAQQTNLNKYVQKGTDLTDKMEMKESNIKKAISNWFSLLSAEFNLDALKSDTQSIVEELYKRLSPLLHEAEIKTDKANSKIELKEEIINFLRENFNKLKINYNNTQINKYADILIILLLTEASDGEKSYTSEQSTYFLTCLENNIRTNTELDKIKRIIRDIIIKNSDKSNLGFEPESIIENITEFLSENLNSILSPNNYQLKVKLFELISSMTGFPDIVTADIADSIIKAINTNNVDNVFKYNSSDHENNKKDHYFGNIISVYKSEHDLHEHPNSSATSIRKRKSSILKKTVKIDPEEQMYMEKLTSLITAWINTLPMNKENNKSKDKKLKANLVNNLVEDILDQVKLEQVAPNTSDERDKYISFFTYRWLNRYEYFKDINEAKPHVDQLIEKIKDIPLPNLIRPQTDNQKSTQADFLSIQKETLKPKELDMLKNEISTWWNEQPSKIFLKRDKSDKEKIIHDFALKIDDSIKKFSSEQITTAIEEWLHEIIKPEHKEQINKYTETLKTKIENIYPNKEAIDKESVSKPKINNSSCCGDNFLDISENAIKELITVYLDHKYDSDNFITRKACTKLLKNELQKLVTLSKEDENILKNIPQATTLEQLSKELKYIKITSDWLQNIQIEESLNKTENNVPTELINNVAKNLRAVEENQEKSSCKRECNHNVMLVIKEFIEQLPPHYKSNSQAMTDDLISKISAVKDLSSCCQSPKKNMSTINLPEQNITNYIEAYLQENDEEIFENDVKLEACILRLFKEINNTVPHSTCVFDESSVPLMNETTRHFTSTMEYVKQISDWLKNLPLLPLADKATQDQLIVMINNLADKISDTENAEELQDYLVNWISKLPLDPGKDIATPLATQQLMKRIKRTQEGNKPQDDDIQKDTPNLTDDNKSVGKVCKYPHSCCNKTISQDNRDPGTVIVEAIEEWVNNLPLEAEDENTCKALKDNVATSIFQKLGELNMNPEYFNNNILYEEMLSEEIDVQLRNLPQNPKLQLIKIHVKKELLNVIMDQRKEIKKKTSAIEYKQDLERTIEMSLPPVPHDDIPAFKMYKDHLATMFILENFDQGNYEIKLKYENIIRKDLEKYYQLIQDNNFKSLTKDQIHNQLYSALSSVPLPNETSLAEEIEEIKTRCEINEWFKTLPLREATNVNEMLEWDQILAMLAKRLHEFERHERDCEDKIHKEITKWLARLPILPNQTNEIDNFSKDLQQRLKSTISDRKHVSKTVNKSQQSVEHNDKGTYNSTEVVDSRRTSSPPSSLPFCCQSTFLKKPKKPADKILEIVETWCQRLPLPANTVQEQENVKIIKDNLIIKIIMKITEINMNPETFNDDFLYDALLDDELEYLMSKLPVSYEFIQSKNERKNQLKEDIKSIKPLIKEEKARYEYKVEVKNTIDRTLNDNNVINNEKSILLESLKEDIAANLITYNFYKENQENSLKYKNLVHDAVEKYYTLIDEDSTEAQRRDSLQKSDQLLYELNKIPTPGETSMLDEVQEIQIKFELTNLFNELSLANDNENTLIKNQIKVTLAKQLNNSMKGNDSSENDRKMKEDIIKNLNKLDIKIDAQKIDMFIKRIKNTYKSVQSYESTEKGKTLTQKANNDPKNEGRTNISVANTEDEQWLSLLPVTPEHRETNYDDTLTTKEYGKTVKPQESEQSFNPNYETFEQGALLSSSVRENRDQSGKVTFKTPDFNQNASSGPSRKITTVDQSTSTEPPKSVLTDSDNATKSQPIQNLQRNPFNVTTNSNIHRDLDQKRMDQTNQTKNKQANAFQQTIEQQPEFQTSNPDTRTFKTQYNPNQFSQPRTMTPQTANQTFPGEPQQQMSRIPIKTRDAYTQETGFFPPTASQQISDKEEIPFENVLEPGSFIPPMSAPTARLCSNKAASHCRGPTCRRPSITIFSPTDLPRCDDEEDPTMRVNSKGQVTDESVTCECFSKRKRPLVCSAHLRRYCTICNEINPFYCRMPSYRYPSFYYH